MELIGHVRALRAVCRLETHGSFTAAAEALGLSQSAVSQHVAALERELGLAVVERGSRPVALTPAGHALVRHGQAILARLDTAEQELAELAGRRSARLRMGTFPTALTTFAPAAIARFRTSRPDVALTVVDDHLQRLLPRLSDRELDLAIVYEDAAGPRREDPDLDWVGLFDDRFRAVLPRGHRLARRTSPLELADLAGEPWIGGGVGSSWFGIVRRACRAHGVDPRVSVGSDDYNAVLALSAAGLGPAVVPGLAAAHPPPNVVVKDLGAWAPSRRIGVVVPREAFPPAATAGMVALLGRAARRYRTPSGGRRVSPR